MKSLAVLNGSSVTLRNTIVKVRLVRITVKENDVVLFKAELSFPICVQLFNLSEDLFQLP